MTENSAYLSFALELMGDVSELLLTKFHEKVEAKVKADSTLVTEADVAAETLIKERIRKRFPDHDVLGDETGVSAGGAEYRWVTDPIDGTQSFAKGIPTFGSMLALYRGEEPLVGIIAHPAMKQTYYAAKDAGCFCNGEKIRINDSAGPGIDKNEIVCICNRFQFCTTGHGAVFDNFWQKHAYIRVYYDCFGLTRAISGQAGAMVEVNVPLWDLAPCRVMVEEAGGVYRRLSLDGSSGKDLYSAVYGKKSSIPPQKF